MYSSVFTYFTYRDRDSLLFVTALDYDSPKDPYELRLQCVELGRPASVVYESDLRLAQSYQESLEELRRAQEDRTRRLRELKEQEERDREERWEEGRRREREQYQQYSTAHMRDLLARDTNNKARVRYRGILLIWKETFGFITLSITGASYVNIRNVFLHTSDIV